MNERGEENPPFAVTALALAQLVNGGLRMRSLAVMMIVVMVMLMVMRVFVIMRMRMDLMHLTVMPWRASDQIDQQTHGDSDPDLDGEDQRDHTKNLCLFHC